MTLGRLTAINPREIWNDEARDFTPWLAQEKNIALLGDTIGIELPIQRDCMRQIRLEED